MDNTSGSFTVVVAALTKFFQDRCAVNNISFSVQSGECLGFLGPNGAGKTTTIKMLLGLVMKSSGRITLLDKQIPEQLPEAKRFIGVVPQDDSLDPDLTVQENLLTYAAFYDIPRQTALAKADELLNFFALAKRKDEIIEHLSGGQRRRLLLARSLINNPKLLILDEPTVGLDPQSRQLIWQHLEMLQEKGITMLLTSHYLDEVERLSDRVIIIDNGTVVAQGVPQQLIEELVGVDVFEVEGMPSEIDVLENAFLQCNATTERINDRLYAYTREDCSRLESLLTNSRKWLRRPANLEDLFIQLTGRSLRES